jgi:uncharacterized protein YuzE
MIRQSYDLTADALYITVTAGGVASTVEIDTGTLVDLDVAGSVVGIEILSPQRCWPLDDILARFSVAAQDVAQLKAYFSFPAEFVKPEHPAPLMSLAV